MTTARSRLRNGARLGVGVLAAALSIPLAVTATGEAVPPGSPGSATTKERTPQRWVVTLGDSYISGEGGRWAGNITGDPERVDALGGDAYHDGPDGERIPG